MVSSKPYVSKMRKGRKKDSTSSSRIETNQRTLWGPTRFRNLHFRIIHPACKENCCTTSCYSRFLLSSICSIASEKSAIRSKTHGKVRYELSFTPELNRLLISAADGLELPPSKARRYAAMTFMVDRLGFLPSSRCVREGGVPLSVVRHSASLAKEQQLVVEPEVLLTRFWEGGVDPYTGLYAPLRFTKDFEEMFLSIETKSYIWC